MKANIWHECVCCAYTYCMCMYVWCAWCNFYYVIYIGNKHVCWLLTDLSKWAFKNVNKTGLLTFSFGMTEIPQKMWMWSTKLCFPTLSQKICTWYWLVVYMMSLLNYNCNHRLPANIIIEIALQFKRNDIWIESTTIQCTSYTTSISNLNYSRLLSSIFYNNNCGTMLL